MLLRALNSAVLLLEGEAVVLEETADQVDADVRRPSPRFCDKHRAAFAEAAFTVETFAAEYPQVVRIRLTRLLDRGRSRHEVRSKRSMATASG
jgi:hypothetical protein